MRGTEASSRPMRRGFLLWVAVVLAAGSGEAAAVQATRAVPQDTAPVARDTVAGAPAAGGTGARSAPSTGVPVVLNRDTLFSIHTPLGPFTAAQRAEATRQRLVELARNPFARLTEVTVVELAGRSDVRMGEQVLTTVTDADAAAVGLTREELAQARAEAIAQALERTAFTTNVRALLLGLFYSLLATVVLVLVLRLLNHVFPRVQRLLRVWQRSRLQALRVQSLEIVSAERIARLVGGLVSLLRLVLTLLVSYVYLLLVFSFFPWTRGVARSLVQYAIEPIVAVVESFISFVPNLFYIVVIVITTHYLLKVIRLIFDGVGSGAIKLAGFYADWADTTYKIVRFVAIALAVILIWPHLPSSDRPEFRGVAAFVGLLLSLGSASAVANVIGGVVMVYMRPFQIGDRVKIADTVGDVIEKTLLVTRVRTPKNVDVTIPNSMVLGSHIINYSSTARERGLVLHTTVTLGYGVPWRKVHDVLIEAARATPDILPAPEPFVLQTALNDHHVSYELNAFTAAPNAMMRTYSALHANIQDRCNEAGIEILSPDYAAHRDGGHTTIPANYLEAGYEPPPIRIEVARPTAAAAAARSGPASSGG
jgi:small-conductance mechanosensitive channel